MKSLKFIGWTVAVGILGVVSVALVAEPVLNQTYEGVDSNAKLGVEVLIEDFIYIPADASADTVKIRQTTITNILTATGNKYNRGDQIFIIDDSSYEALGDAPPSVQDAETKKALSTQSQYEALEAVLTRSVGGTKVRFVDTSSSAGVTEDSSDPSPPDDSSGTDIDDTDDGGDVKKVPIDEGGEVPASIRYTQCTNGQEGKLFKLPNFNDQDCQNFDVVIGMLKAAGNTLISLVLAVALIFLLITGYQFATSAGNKEGMQTAKRSLLYIILGIGIVLSAYMIVRFFADQFLTGG